MTEIILVWGEYMTYKEIIFKELQRQHKSEPDLQRALGITSNSTIWRPLHEQQDIKLGKFLAFVDALGFEVIVRPKGKKRTKYFLTKEN